MGSLIGGGGGAGGTGFAGAERANIVNTTDKKQIDTGYAASQDALAQQKALMEAIQMQNGIQNQSQIYNQLQQIAAGQGPDPAQAALNQATGQNVANQAALMAGQRGAAGNVGLLARQAAQAGGNLQQQAAGQGATMQAQQRMNAINAAGAMANQQAANQLASTNANTQSQTGFHKNLMDAQQGVNQSNVEMQSNINNNNAAMAQAAMANQSKGAGGLMSAMGPLVSMGLGAMTGGMAPLAMGALGAASGGSSGGGSKLGSMLVMAEGGKVEEPEQHSFLGKYAKGGSTNTVPALVSPGERYLPPSEVSKVAKGVKNPMEAGEKIPGKPKVAGAKNLYANDTVKKDLKEGGIVLPRSVTQAKDPQKKAAEFVAAILKQKALKGKK